MKRTILIISLFIFTCSCQKDAFRSFGQSDIDIVSEIHAKTAKEITEALTIKLYKINPKELAKNKQHKSVSSVIIDIFSNKEIDIDSTGEKNIKLILDGFDKDSDVDRIYYTMKGLYGMIRASYNYKTEFYLTDKKLDAQKLYNSARNIEVFVWRLSNTKDKMDNLLIKTNNMQKGHINLSFERLFGKLIANQDIISKSIASQEGRAIQKVAKSIASAIFLPIGL